jgi:predicted acyl esterase
MTFHLGETMTSEAPAPSASEVMVPTRDGVKLATDVYLPDGDGPFSAVFVRTPYDKSSRYTAIRYEAEYFCGRGYAYVAQDVRGKFRSTGATVPYVFDVADGWDSAEWIAHQPWSDGTIGAVGASYYGFTCWATVASGHPAVRAAVPQVTGIDMGARHVGSRWSLDNPSNISLQDLVQIWTDNDGHLVDVDWGSGQVHDLLSLAREVLGPSIGVETFLEGMQHQSWVDPYGSRNPLHTTTVPILHWQNYYDPGLAPAGFHDWRHFRSQPGSRHLHYLRAASADHAGFLLEDVDAGDSKNPYLDDETMWRKIHVECGEMADFFDEHVKDIKPLRPRPRARWHLGHVGWQHSSEWPPPSIPKTFHLASDGSGPHRLAEGVVTHSRALTWTHDPHSPVPSSTDIETFWYLLAGYPDERNLAERSDVLTFRTAPLAEDLDFAGQPRLDVQLEYASASTHVFVRLQDVFPDDTTRPISWGRAVLVEPYGTELRLLLDDNAYRLQAGHRLQLQIASSDFPHFVTHPGTDESPWTATTKVAVEQRLLLGGDRTATLTLPVITVG